MWVLLLFLTQFARSGWFLFWFYEVIYSAVYSEGANLIAMACRFDPTLPYCAKPEHVQQVTSLHVNKDPTITHSNDLKKDTLFWPEVDGSEELFTGYNTYVQRDLKNANAEQKRSVHDMKTVNRAYAVPVVPSDARYSSGGDDAFKAFDQFTDSRGVLHRPKSSSPFSKPGLWEPNPADPHSRDPANKYWYHPESVGVDWLNGQLQWGAHWAVPAAGVGGTDGMSTLHFPSIGQFLNIPDDYD